VSWWIVKTYFATQKLAKDACVLTWNIFKDHVLRTERIVMCAFLKKITWFYVYSLNDISPNDFSPKDPKDVVRGNIVIGV
jgi:hypothetical protein